MQKAEAALGVGNGFRKIEELEGVRGLAAILVVLFHIPHWNPLCDIGIINNGSLMVDLFFVLSGYIIYSTYGNKISSAKELFRFQFLRLGRLYPVHILFLLIFLIFEIGKYIIQVKFGISSPNNLAFKNNNLATFVEQLFLVQSVLPDNGESYNYPAWSISVEFYTYLIFGFIMLFSSKTRNYYMGAIVLISLILLVTESTYGFSPLLRCNEGFFIGCFTAYFSTRIKAVQGYYSYIFFFGIICFLQMNNVPHLQYLIYFLTSGLIVGLVNSDDGLLKKVLRSKPIAWLGSISYSIYMSHAAIVWVSIQILRFVFLRKEIVVKGNSIPQLGAFESICMYFIVIFIVLLVSQCVYIFIENPFRKKTRNLAFTYFS